MDLEKEPWLTFWGWLWGALGNDALLNQGAKEYLADHAWR